MRTMFTPLKIAGMEVKNRTFMAPMSLGYESQDGTVNEKMEAYWLRRAQGGVGCIIVDATSVDPNVPYLGNTLCFRDEESIKKNKEDIQKRNNEIKTFQQEYDSLKIDETFKQKIQEALLNEQNLNLINKIFEKFFCLE